MLIKKGTVVTARDDGVGVPDVVMQPGNVLVEKDEWFGREGQGAFVPRSRFREP